MGNKKNKTSQTYWKKVLKIFPEDKIANFHLTKSENHLD